MAESILIAYLVARSVSNPAYVDLKSVCNLQASLGRRFIGGSRIWPIQPGQIIVSIKTEIYCKQRKSPGDDIASGGRSAISGHNLLPWPSAYGHQAGQKVGWLSLISDITTGTLDRCGVIMALSFVAHRRICMPAIVTKSPLKIEKQI